jgi:hypothetical protein
MSQKAKVMAKVLNIDPVEMIYQSHKNMTRDIAERFIDGDPITNGEAILISFSVSNCCDLCKMVNKNKYKTVLTELPSFCTVFPEMDEFLLGD